MRLWSIHPKYLDAKGLVACWRESLLAQSVLMNLTKGYKNHPQLNRFKSCSDPLGAIGAYLTLIYREAKTRNYNFDYLKIKNVNNNVAIDVANKQIDYEFTHLMNKLAIRDLTKYNSNLGVSKIEIFQIFQSVDGEIADWEIVN